MDEGLKDQELLNRDRELGSILATSRDGGLELGPGYNREEVLSECKGVWSGCTPL